MPLFDGPCANESMRQRKLASSADRRHRHGYAAGMKSPFPGMDPHLERYRGDVHHSLIQYTRDALQPRLPDDLRARVEERVFIESEPERIRQVVPDVYVSQILQALVEQVYAGGRYDDLDCSAELDPEQPLGPRRVFAPMRD